MGRLEKGNRYRKEALSTQKSAEVIVAEQSVKDRINRSLKYNLERRNGQMGAENKRESCSQRDSAERKGYVRAHRSFNRIWKERDSAEPDILGKILDRDNLNRAYKRVKATKGAPGIDGMTIEAVLPWLKEHKDELIGRIKRGKYTPSPVRRVEIPKPDGGIRKLGIPTVIDRIIQQAIAQKLMPIYEPMFTDGSLRRLQIRQEKESERLEERSSHTGRSRPGSSESVQGGESSLFARRAEGDSQGKTDSVAAKLRRSERQRTLPRQDTKRIKPANTLRKL